MTVDRRDEGSSGHGAAVEGPEGGERWREVVRLLEANARARTRLEAVETALLREARACDVPARLGYVSLEEFVERHLGYGRHAANERCRVSLELEALPRLRAAYADGTLAFSHVRELTRVATPQTEGAYLAAAAGKTTRQVQQLVSGKRAGDAPEAPPDPALVKHTIVLELGGEAFAMWRRAQQVLEDEVGERLSPDELVMQLCTQAFAPAGRAEASDDGAPGMADRPDRSRGTTATTTGAAPGSAPSRGTTAAPADAALAPVPAAEPANAAVALAWSRGTTAARADAELGSAQSRVATAAPVAAELDSVRSRGTTEAVADTAVDSVRSRGTTAVRVAAELDSVQSRGTTEAVADAEPALAWSRGMTAAPVVAELDSVQSRGTTAARADAEPGSAQSRGTTAVPFAVELDSGQSRGTTAARPDAESGSGQSRGTATDADPPGGDAPPSRARTRGPRIAPPPTLHAVTTCRSCQRATASGVGSAEPLTPAQRDRALCDAIHVGDLDTSERTRPSLTVPPAIRRKVAIACNHACVVPGCRSRRHLAIHHLRYQAHGGGHTVENCVQLCHAHHDRLHAGRLRIEGTAPHGLDIAWRHPATNEEQDAGAGPWVWRRVPPDPVHSRRDR